MNKAVVDASALLAYLQGEKGGDQLEDLLLDGIAVVSTVNIAEVVTKLTDRAMPLDAITSVLEALDMTLVDFDREQAYCCGELRSATRHLGLSMGDRACLSLAKKLQLPVWTTDKVWESFCFAMPIKVLR